MFVVDDSAVARRLVADAVAGDPAVVVAGTAADGRAAVGRVRDLRPDLVVLDVEMPELDGIGTLDALRAAGVRVPVVMFSALTRRGAAATLDALARGAADYVTKPAGGSPAEAVAAVRAALVPKIKALTGRPGGGGEPSRVSVAQASGLCEQGAPPARPPARPDPVGAVVVGVSTGGPNALATVLPALPPDLPVPVLVVQHMPAEFTRLMADRLAGACRLPVAEAADGEPVRPGRVYLAPGGRHLAVAPGAAPRVRLTDAPPEHFCRPAADVLFRSAADVYGAATLAVVLTGMGRDGTAGSRAVREAGGRVVVQDEGSSVVWGMPGSVARAGLADEVVPLDEVARAVARRVWAGRPTARPA